ncbi:MAG TPA: hypothetical protein DDX19_20155 [Rhodopirellula baltica]|nr:hypothetical protein [Rhodopirellula baltica]
MMQFQPEEEGIAPAPMMSAKRGFPRSANQLNGIVETNPIAIRIGNPMTDQPDADSPQRNAPG